MSDDNARPVLSLKRKVVPGDAPAATSPASREDGPGIVVSRRKTVVVNTDPKRNKKALPDDVRKSAPQPGHTDQKKTQPKAKKKPKTSPPARAVKVVPPAPRKKPRPGRSPRLMRPADAVKALSTHWPGLFSGGRMRPLTVGMKEQLFADVVQRELPLSNKVIRRCLKTLTRTETYLTSLTAGAACYNADGSVESLIPPEREAAAKVKLADVLAHREKIKLKKQAAASADNDNKEP